LFLLEVPWTLITHTSDGRLHFSLLWEFLRTVEKPPISYFEKVKKND
jgi:hypothetical protein